MVGVEHRAGSRDVVAVLGRDVPRQLEDGVQPGADPRRLGALVAGALELADLAQQRLADGVRHVGRLDPRAVVVGALGLALAELLADRVELLAQQELALALLHALADVLADLVGDLDLGEVLPGPLDQHRQPLLDVGRLEQLPLAVVGQVRRVAGRVRDGTGVGHAVHRVDDLPGLAALEHGHDEPLVLLRELAGVLGDVLVLLGDDVDLDPQRRAGAGDAAADAAALLGLEDGRGGSPAEPADPLDAGDDAVRRVAVLEPGGDQQPAVAAGAGRVDGGLRGLVELDGHDHARQHDEVGDEENGKAGGHECTPFELERCRLNFRRRRGCSAVLPGRTPRPRAPSSPGRAPVDPATRCQPGQRADSSRSTSASGGQAVRPRRATA